MNDPTEIASWYQPDDCFDPTAKLILTQSQCVQHAESVARVEEHSGTFAEELLALAEMTKVG